MVKMSPVKRTCIAAVCVALCCVVPQAFHAVGLGGAFSPMHIPVLLCGMICGGWHGLFCGILGPVLSSVLTGMPGTAMLASMIPELAAYGLISGVLMQVLHTGKEAADLYISLGISMVLGRVVGGIAKALFFSGGEAFTLAVWVSSYFTAALPGILLHLILIPLLPAALRRARVIPKRY